MKALAEQISDIDGINIYGRVVGVRGLMVEIAGPIHAMSVGARIVIDTGGNRFIPCEVIGFTGSKGGALGTVCDHVLIAPSDDTAVIQQIHLAVAHGICEEIEQGMMREAAKK